MVEFKFAKYGENFGTREMGAKIRQELLVLLEGDERIVLDFTGVNVVTNSFADECIAKLLLDMPLVELKKKNNIPRSESCGREKCPGGTSATLQGA